MYEDRYYNYNSSEKKKHQRIHQTTPQQPTHPHLSRLFVRPRSPTRRSSRTSISSRQMLLLVNNVIIVMLLLLCYLHVQLWHRDWYHSWGFSPDERSSQLKGAYDLRCPKLPITIIRYQASPVVNTQEDNADKKKL